LKTSKLSYVLQDDGVKLFPIRRKERKYRDTASEAALEKRLVKAVKKAGGVAIKLPSSWYKGIPDRMVLLPGGRVFFVELKRHKKKARKAQLKWIARLERLGFNVSVEAGSKAVTRFINDQVSYRNHVGISKARDSRF
jgi:hypothetical protein